MDLPNWRWLNQPLQSFLIWPEFLQQGFVSVHDWIQSLAWIHCRLLSEEAPWWTGTQFEQWRVNFLQTLDAFAYRTTCPLDAEIPHHRPLSVNWPYLCRTTIKAVEIGQKLTQRQKQIISSQLADIQTAAASFEEWSAQVEDQWQLIWTRTARDLWITKGDVELILKLNKSQLEDTKRCKTRRRIGWAGCNLSLL